MYPAYKKENDDWVLDYDIPMAEKLWEAFAGKNQYIEQIWNVVYAETGLLRWFNEHKISDSRSINTNSNLIDALQYVLRQVYLGEIEGVYYGGMQNKGSLSTLIGKLFTIDRTFYWYEDSSDPAMCVRARLHSD